jgi:transposase InsO family protein
VKFAFIAQMGAEKAFPIAFMCRMLEVSRQGFYQWRSRPPSTRVLRDAELTERIRKIHKVHGGRVGVRRVRDELARAGVVCSHKRTHRLMRAAGLRGVHPRPYKRTTESGRFNPALADLLHRDWTPAEPNLAWVGDITYIKTWTGWAYLATVIDCYSRRVVGWAIADHMRTDLIIDALRMAIIHRNPKCAIFHSDRGSQYTSDEFRDFCRANDVRPSVGRTGICYDNAVAESFFGTLKKELIHTRPWPTLDKLRTAVFEYIESYYNRRRRHSTIGYDTPIEHEMKYALTRLQTA